MAGGSEHEEGTWAWRERPTPQPLPSPPSSQVTPGTPALHLQDDHQTHTPPDPPPAIGEKLVDDHIICAHHPSTPGY